MTTFWSRREKNIENESAFTKGVACVKLSAVCQPPKKRKKKFQALSLESLLIGRDDAWLL